MSATAAAAAVVECASATAAAVTGAGDKEDSDDDDPDGAVIKNIAKAVVIHSIHLSWVITLYRELSIRLPVDLLSIYIL